MVGEGSFVSVPNYANEDDQRKYEESKKADCCHRQR